MLSKQTQYGTRNFKPKPIHKSLIMNVFVWALCTLSLSFTATTQANDESSGVNNDQTPPMEVLKNFKGKNQLRLLKNRFRIDYQVDELLLLMFRKHGSQPVVLVRPDGSKIYVTAGETGEVDWHADVSYDLIRLKNPMPGPWQALGKIMDTSKILVLSDVQLVVDNLPKQVFQTQKIKTKASILNAGSMLNDPALRDVVRLKAYLYSTNEPELQNFGASIYRMGEFADDGRGLDERPRDGQFTIELKFNSELGNWKPKFTAKAELFTREVVLDPITVLPSPVRFEVNLAEPDEKYHTVSLAVDDTHIDDASLVFQGTVEYPNGDSETFHLNQGQVRELSIFQAEYGMYKVTAEAFGQDKNGNEFVLSPPTFEFATVEPLLDEIIEEPVVDEEALAALAAQKEAEVAAALAKQKAEDEKVPVGLIVTLNLLILIVGAVVIWKFVLGKPIPNPFKNIKFKRKSKTKDKDDDDSNKDPGPEKKAPENESSDDILDLSLPDD
jgi:uncharacterized protein (TIGR03503 family)